MIDRINATIDVYSHLRVEVALRDQGRARARAEKNVSPTGNDTDSAASRRTRAVEADESDKIVRFAQSSAGGEEPGDIATAEEVMPALEASVLPSDPFLAAVAKLYRSAGRLAAGSALVGTRLDAVA